MQQIPLILHVLIGLINFNFCLVEGKRKSQSDGSDSNEENLSKKELALQQALDQITTTFGKGSIMWLGRSVSHKHVPVVSTGSFSLDIALGIGGLPKGRVVEIYGPEASGKTTLALHVIAEAQKQGGYCVFVDAEHALDPALAEAIGVNTENLLLSQPDCGEQALSLVDTLIRSGSVDVVVVDSVAALVPKGELDGEMGDAHMAMQARLMSQALRKLSHSLSLSQTILIFVNQATGSQVLVKIVKNKHAPPFKTAQFELEFGKGICLESEIMELGCKHKFITKVGGAVYSMNGQSFRGKDAIKQYLAENANAKEELMTKLREKLLGFEVDREKESDIDEDPAEEIISPDSTDEEEMSLGMVPQLPDKDETNFPWKQIFATLDVFVGALAAELLVFGETKILLGHQMLPSRAKTAVTENAIMKFLFLRQNYNDNGKSVSTAGAAATSATTTMSAKDQTGDTASVGS
ncbi:recA DNA recombination family protein [Actinidia rufa]|uniref:RecA DNA recombination family protein n=1 Tax=Actinidia rufa TaxID=165716 RepID=A0A7J0F5Q9_9ERIC|nr:recA DNA recombination family protein [Actinidia rufa]